MKKWWGARHVRWLWLSWRVYNFAQDMAQCGLGLGIPNESDLRYLDAVWRGEV
jgi:hypothetical protein